MESSVYSLSQIFNERLFIIPDYQRGYAWEDIHCKELMEDIELLPPGKEHYTGTLVLHQQADAEVTDASGTLYKTYHVVDGQQRLTTLTLLLHTVQHALREADSITLADGIRTRYIYAEHADGLNQPIYKLTLNDDSREFFRNQALGIQRDLTGAQILSHRRLAGTRLFFDKYLAAQQTGVSPQDFVQWLKSLNEKVTQRLKVSVYQVVSTTEVGVIFEVMNNRGKPLSELEKVKNYLLYLCAKLDLGDAEIKALTNLINTSWRTVFEALMSADLKAESEDQLLRTHWLMAYDHIKKNWAGSKSIKNHFDLRKFVGRHSELYNQVQEYVKTLSNCSIAFTDLEAPDRDGTFQSLADDPSAQDRAQQWSSKLRRLNTLASLRPLLLACRLRGTAAEYADLSELLEKFAFRVYNRLVKLRADTGQSGLFSTAYRYYHGQLTLVQVQAEVHSIMLRYASDTMFANSLALADGVNENRYEWNALNYFLYEYEEQLAHRGVKKPWKDLRSRETSIEHILPRTPTNLYWTTRFDTAALRACTHNLGNLCLTLDNSAYGNRDFDAKKGHAGSAKPCYANASLYQERQLANEEEWTPTAISARRATLVEWALKRWAVAIPPLLKGVNEVAAESATV